MIGDFVQSVVRTYVPVAVGSLLAWAATLGFDIDPNAANSLIVGLTAIIIALYYGIVRLIERKYPSAGVLLGSKAQPHYATEVAAVADPSGDGGYVADEAAPFEEGTPVEIVPEDSPKTTEYTGRHREL